MLGNGYETGTASSAQVSKDATRVLALDALSGDLDNSANRLHDCINDVRQMADRLFGSQPETIGEASGKPSDPTRLSGLADQSRNISALIAVLQDQIDRLKAL